jgi:hypothetical protein
MKDKAVNIKVFQRREAVVATEWTSRTVLVDEEVVN